jgi:hypothetical protein
LTLLWSSLATQTDAKLALASVVLITTQFEDAFYEVTFAPRAVVAGAGLHQRPEAKSLAAKTRISSLVGQPVERPVFLEALSA